MRKLGLSVLFLFLLSSLGASSAGAKTSPSPFAMRIVTEDIARFWQAFDASETEGAAAFERLYLKPGTPGLQDFVPNRIGSAKHLFETVQSHKQYYRSLRQATLDVSRYEKAIQASFFAMEYLYPDATFPNVYLVIGALNSAGTSSSNGLIIGLDMHGRTPEMPVEELNRWLRDVIKPLSDLPYIVAHELIHFEQRDPPDETLLAAVLREGSADFLGELISGRQINDLAHAYGFQHEADLWQEFQGRMKGKDLKGWLYSESPGRPNDLGYWMGYVIARSYYGRAADKRLAVRDILNITDAQKFLERSGYSPPGAPVREVSRP